MKRIAFDSIVTASDYCDNLPDVVSEKAFTMMLANQEKYGELFISSSTLLQLCCCATANKYAEKYS